MLMVPTTATALVLLVVAVLPGSVYTWAFERQASAYGVTLADRVLRFVAVSLAYDVAYAWPAYLLRRNALPPWRPGAFAVVWAAVLVGLGVPACVGTVIGGLYATRGTRSGWRRLRDGPLTARREARLLRFVLGPDPAPRAWDDFFSRRPAAYLRIRTREGEWVGGRYGSDSYAGSFPNDADLLLEEAWATDDNGLLVGPGLGYPVYVSASTIAFMDILSRHDVAEVNGDG
jgi:hypothetical protein